MRRRSTRPAGLVLVLSFLVPTVAAAWGAAGHQAVGEIAAHYLTPEAERALRRLLRNASYDTLAEAGYWADAHARRFNRYWEYGRRHYVNVDPSATAVDMDRDCPEDCILLELERLTDKLRDRPSQRGDHADEFRFLVHFVEDLHQPLHVSHPDNRGGNETRVILFGEPMNLHWVWDGGLIARRLASYGPRQGIGWRSDERWRRWAYDLRLEIGPEELAAWTASGDFGEWARESLEAARQHTFEVASGAELGEAYYQATLPVVEQRIKMAGVRLAALLNEIYSERPMFED